MFAGRSAITMDRIPVCDPEPMAREFRRMDAGRRKIAVVVPKYGLVGGTERHVRELTEHIAANPRYEIHVFANRWQAASDRVIFHKVPIITFPKFLTTISFAFFAQMLISRMDFDIVHSHDRIFDADIHTMHGVPHRYWVKNIRKKKFMSLFDHATAFVENREIENMKGSVFIAVSDLAKEKFAEEFDMDPSRVRVMTPGVDTEIFRPLAPESRKDIRLRMGFGDSDVVVIFVGMNFEVKGLDTLMAAVSMAKSENPLAKLKLLVVGNGNYHKYSVMAEKLGIDKDTTFAGVCSEGIEELYGASDIFSMLSDMDSFGMSVSEAMSCGLPVIVSQNVGAKEIVKDGVNGYIANNDDIEGIASKLLILTDTRYRKNMGASARQTALARTWDAMAEQMSEIYETLAKGNG